MVACAGGQSLEIGVERMKADGGRDTPSFVQTGFRVVNVVTGNKPKGGPSPELPYLEIDQSRT